MATLRQRRYGKFINAGFLPFEARILTSTTRVFAGRRKRVRGLPLNVPYIKLMIKERRDALAIAREMKISKKEWRATIMDMYVDHNWLSRGKADPWQMVRDWEDRYERVHPEYSPDYDYKRKRPKTPKLYDELYNSGKPKGRLTPLERYDIGRGR